MRILNIAYKRIKNGNIGAGAVFFFAAVLSFTIFTGQFLAKCLNAGAANLKERLGADIAVVERGQEGSYQGILLSGEPVKCTLDRDIEKELHKIKGVEKVTPIIYLASLNASCCSVPIQLVGYEPESDFVTAPWISEQYVTKYDGGDLVVGCNIAVDEDDKLTFFGRTYQVGARLNKTGTGMDKSVYVTFDIMEQMIHDAQKKGIRFEVEEEAQDPEMITERITDKVVSAFLIRIEEGADQDTVAGQILRNTQAGVVQSKNLLSIISDSMGFFSKMIFLITGGMMVLVTAVTAVLHIFRVNIRRKEWAVFLMMGASRGFIMRLILAETVLLAVAGVIVGIAVSSLFVFPFQDLIAEQIRLPFYSQGIGDFIGAVLFSMFLTVMSGVLPGVAAGILAANTDCYELMREGDK